MSRVPPPGVRTKKCLEHVLEEGTHKFWISIYFCGMRVRGCGGTCALDHMRMIMRDGTITLKHPVSRIQGA